MNQPSPKTAIFIKSYPGDFGWLAYCLRSIKKFVTGHHEVVVVLPEGCHYTLVHERAYHLKEWPDPIMKEAPTPGYYHAMYAKMIADKICPDAEAILYVDSDCVFTRPFDVSELFADGKAKILHQPWENSCYGSGKGVIWRPAAEKALGYPCEHDLLVCFPFIYWADTIRSAREAVEAQHSLMLEDYIRSQERFIEFVTMSNYALKNEPDRYLPIEVAPGDAYPRPLNQYWSHGGITPQIASEIEQILQA